MASDGPNGNLILQVIIVVKMRYGHMSSRSKLHHSVPSAIQIADHI